GGYFARYATGKKLIVAFRGADQVQAYFHNFQPKLDPWGTDSNIQVHHGFKTSFNTLADTLIQRTRGYLDKYPDHQLWVIGQSLGGVHATMLATRLLEIPAAGLKDRMVLTTFGRPRLGNKNFAAYIIGLGLVHQRVTNKNDIFSRIPLRRMGYLHENDEFFI
ncbi:Alpha/Beta hydrolase protein, partial [Dimargaris cristalligena]